MEFFTIGFTQTTAADFFGKLKKHGIRRLVEVRLNNVSQLAGFTKRDDLSYFLTEICGAEYLHETQLAPTQDMLDAYKKLKGSWDNYERLFLELMAERRIEERMNPDLFAEPERHWLQINNLHFVENPFWRLPVGPEPAVAE